MFFNRKKRNDAAAHAEHQQLLLEELSKPVCQQRGHTHEWRDFPPYLIYEWHGSNERSNITIKEPYCCIFCGEVVTKTLLERELYGYSQKQFFEFIDDLKKENKELGLKPQAVVMDMVEDEKRVDRQKLKIWDQLHSPDRIPSDSFELVVGRSKDYANERKPAKPTND